MQQPVSRAHVYTDFFHVPRYINHIKDLRWGFSIPLVSGGATAVVLLLELRLGLASLLGHLPAPFSWLAIAALPAAAWWFSGKPNIEGRSVQDWSLAQLRYWLLEPRQLVGDMEAVHEPQRQRHSISAWSPRR